MEAESCAYDALRDYISTEYSALNTHFENAMYALTQENLQHIRYIDDYIIQYTHLNMDSINRDITRLHRTLLGYRALHGLLSFIHPITYARWYHNFQTQIDLYQGRLDEQIEKRDRFNDYLNASASLYSNMFTELNSHIIRLDMTMFNAQSGVATLPSMSEVQAKFLLETLLPNEGVLAEMERFFVNGELDIVAVAILFDSLVTGEWCDLSYNILLAIHVDPRVDEWTIAAIYEQLSRMSIQPHLESDMLDLVQKLAHDVSSIFMAEYNLYRLCPNRPNLSRDERELRHNELESRLLRAQFITFIGGTPTVQWQKLNRVYMCLDLFNSDHGGYPEIDFLGTLYAGTTLEGLWNSTTCLVDMNRGRLSAEERELMNSSRGEYLLTMALLIAGNVKVIGASAGFKIVKIISDGQKMIYIVNEVTGYSERITAAEYSFMQQRGALAIAELGGGFAGMATPNGYRIIGTSVYTQDAMINFAGIERVHGFTPEETMKLMTPDRAEGRDNIRDFLNNAGLHQTIYNFNHALNCAHNRLYDNNVAGIPAPADTPNIAGLPFHVLQEIIDHEVAIDALGGVR